MGGLHREDGAAGAAMRRRAPAPVYGVMPLTPPSRPSSMAVTDYGLFAIGGVVPLIITTRPSSAGASYQGRPHQLPLTGIANGIPISSYLATPVGVITV